MNQRKIDLKLFTVGWVCALPIELAAAQEILDERYQDLSYQDANDTNIYTLGRIDIHNVVIACLPAGQTGTSSAAVIATRMKSTFTGIRFGLMVGIGGGVPSDQADIRLGDVVISQPTKQNGGVVQYDMGKVRPRICERTGALNSPPEILLNAVSKFKANELRGMSNLASWLSILSSSSVFTPENAGSSALLWAARNGDESILQLLLDFRADGHARGRFGWTALHYAVLARHKAIVQLLLEYNVDIDIRDDEGYTALSWATRHGYEDIAGLLLGNKDTEPEDCNTGGSAVSEG